MVLELASHLARSFVDPIKAIYCALVVAFIIVSRSWARGYINHCERDLHDKTYLLVGCFSGPGLSLLQSLASRGAQIVALHPNPTSPDVLQLVLLLRSVSRNERIYADECNFLSIASIRTFAQRWATEGKSGMVQDLEARIEGIVFSDGDGSGLPASPSTQDLHQLYVGSRHALVQLLLPTLLRSSKNSTNPIRIISHVPPFYSAAVPPSATVSLESLLPSSDNSMAAPTSPWIVEARASLASVVLVREMHTRLSARDPNLLFVSVCPGFTRSWIYANLRLTRGGFLLPWLLCPIVWLLAKSADEASQGLLSAVLADPRKPVGGPPSGAKSSSASDKVEAGQAVPSSFVLKGGILLREGLEVRVSALEGASPTLGSELWDAESQIVEALVAEAANAEKAGGTKSGAGAAASRKKTDKVE